MSNTDENLNTGTGLPENAFRELGADEKYTPVMHPAHDQSEVTPYSVGMGLLMAVVFSAAAAYLGLKVGQVFEAAIPIAIIAVGLSNALGKKHPLGQNVITPEHRSMLWRDRGGSHIHASGPVHPPGQVSRHHSALLRDIPLVASRRNPRHPLLHPFQEIFRERHARQVSLP